MHSAAVDVWTARPPMLADADCVQLAALLDEAERDRAQALQLEPDRRAWTVAHALQRLALGTAVGADPRDLRFAAGPHGRPLLQDDAAPAFSLAHCRALVACAVAPHGGVVGVDVEAIRDGVGPELLEPFMQPLQGGGLELFYLQWTALEAYWKARGLGLSAAHPRIALEPLEGGGHAVLEASGGRRTGLVAWQLPAPDGLVLSVACDESARVRLLALDALGPQPAGSAPLTN